MTRPLGLTFAIGSYIHAEPLFDGRVTVEGVEIDRLDIPPAELFRRAVIEREFDVCEMSLSSHMTGVGQGGWPYVGIPVFPSRLLRHSMIFVRAAAGIREPADLRGRRVGVPEYHMTAALFARGLLADDFGVRAEDVTWVQGGMWEPGRVERVRLDLPPAIELVVERERDLESMLLAGDLDAVMGPYVPRAFAADPDGPVRRLFRDPETAEREWLARTGILPIMHLVVIREELLRDHPWLAGVIVAGFERARDLTLELLSFQGASKLCLPFLKYELERTRALVGPDLWPYGIEPNRKVLETATRYAHEQGLTRDRLPVEELFAVPSSDERRPPWDQTCL